jgi:hypothetical protein
MYASSTVDSPVKEICPNHQVESLPSWWWTSGSRAVLSTTTSQGGSPPTTTTVSTGGAGRCFYQCCAFWRTCFHGFLFSNSVARAVGWYIWWLRDSCGTAVVAAARLTASELQRQTFLIKASPCAWWSGWCSRKLYRSSAVGRGMFQPRGGVPPWLVVGMTSSGCPEHHDQPGGSPPTTTTLSTGGLAGARWFGWCSHGLYNSRAVNRDMYQPPGGEPPLASCCHQRRRPEHYHQPGLLSIH